MQYNVQYNAKVKYILFFMIDANLSLRTLSNFTDCKCSFSIAWESANQHLSRIKKQPF